MTRSGAVFLSSGGHPWKKSYAPRSLVIPALSSGVIWGIAQVRSDLRFSHWVRMGKGQRWGLAKSLNSRLFEDNTLVSLFRFMVLYISW